MTTEHMHQARCDAPAGQEIDALLDEYLSACNRSDVPARDAVRTRFRALLSAPAAAQSGAQGLTDDLRDSMIAAYGVDGFHEFSAAINAAPPAAVGEAPRARRGVDFGDDSYRRAAPPAAVQDDPWTPEQLDGIRRAVRDNCGPATGWRVHEILSASQARPDPAADAEPVGAVSDLFPAARRAANARGIADDAALYTRPAAPKAEDARDAEPHIPVAELLRIYDEEKGDWCGVAREVERRTIAAMKAGKA